MCGHTVLGGEGGWWWVAAVPAHLAESCLALADPRQLLEFERRAATWQGPSGVGGDDSGCGGGDADDADAWQRAMVAYRLEGLRMLDRAWHTYSPASPAPTIPNSDGDDDDDDNGWDG